MEFKTNPPRFGKALTFWLNSFKPFDIVQRLQREGYVHIYGIGVSYKPTEKPESRVVTLHDAELNDEQYEFVRVSRFFIFKKWILTKESVLPKQFRIVGYLNRNHFFPSSVAVVVIDRGKTFLMYADGHKEDFEEFNSNFLEIEANFYKEKDYREYKEGKAYFMFSPDRIVCESSQNLVLLLEQELDKEKDEFNQEVLKRYIKNIRSKSP